MRGEPDLLVGSQRTDEARVAAVDDVEHVAREGDAGHRPERRRNELAAGERGQYAVLDRLGGAGDRGVELGALVGIELAELVAHAGDPRALRRDGELGEREDAIAVRAQGLAALRSEPHRPGRDRETVEAPRGGAGG